MSAHSEYLTVSPRPTFWRRFIRFQVEVSHAFDRHLPERFRVDGNRDFLDDLVPRYTRPGMVLYDVGGGRDPILSEERKRELGITMVGVDVSATELAAAPAGAYDATVCGDICEYRGNADADLVTCQAVLEHVKDTSRALGAIAGVLKPGGCALIFVPSRNAVFARLNLLLPSELKNGIMRRIFPEMGRDHGFPAFYNRCTPKALDRIAARYGLVRVHRRVYFLSSYFSFLFPLYFVWRLWIFLFALVAGPEAAETFSVVYCKVGEPQQ